VKPLPSSDSAAAVISGDFSALPTAALHMAGRGVLLWVGMRFAGMEPPTAFRAAVAGTAVIETFALAWFAWQRWRK